MRVWLLFALATQVVLTTSEMQAQVVRGVVREATTGTPIAGVLVSLERQSTDTSFSEIVVSALSNERGEFAIRAFTSGRYRLAAKRIGVRRTRIDAFDIGPNETRQFTIELDPVLTSLPEVAVITADFCVPKHEQVRRVAALWEEMRTALTATSISVRDSLYRGRIVSFARLLDGKGRILREDRQQFEGLLNETFSGTEPESLSINGYWSQDADSVRFHALDVEVLLSRSFRRQHCFEMVDETRGEVGLRFEPVPRRMATDVRGTIWADARTFELRRLEFTFTHLPRVQRVEALGGEVHFARLASGVWVVRRWSLRVPQFEGGFLQNTRRFDRANPSVIRLELNRAVPNRIVESGGIAYVDHLRMYENPARVRGVAQDSMGAPVTSAIVRLAGTLYADSVDATGRFELDSVPPGLYRIELMANPMAELDVAAAEQEVTVNPGDDVAVTLKGSELNGLLARMCGGRTIDRERTALKVVLVDSLTSVPGRTLRLWWTEYVRQRGANRVVKQQLDATTADDGSSIFCGLPLNVTLDLGLAIGPDRARRLETLTLSSRVPIVRTVRQD